jgi:hypothetical protein
MLAVFFATIDDNHPKYDGYDSLLKDNPGKQFMASKIKFDNKF